jgi:hypothetical protein
MKYMIFTTTINGKPLNIEAETKQEAEQAAYIYKQLIEITNENNNLN